LNTTGANWTSTYIYGGLTLGTVTVSPADQAAITDIGFSEVYYNGYSSVGQINNLTLTVTSVVPEPSTYAMMLGGLGMLLGMQKFRSRKH